MIRFDILLKYKNNKFILDKEDKKILKNKKGVYIFFIEDKSVYIGQSTNLLDRMICHKTIFNSKNEKQINAMSFYKHIILNNLFFKIVIFIMDDNTPLNNLLNKEEELIFKFRKYSKFKVLNKTNGGYSLPFNNTVDISYYETHPIENYAFIELCKRKGLNPEKFIRTPSNKKSSKGHSLFYYKYDDKVIQDTKIIKNIYGYDNPNAKEISYYETNPITVDKFKQICKRRNLNFNYFKFIFSHKKNNKNYFYVKYIGENNDDIFCGLNKNKGKHKERIVFQYSLDGNLLNKYNSITEAYTMTKVYRSGISQCCNGIIKQAGGFIWKFEEK